MRMGRGEVDAIHAIHVFGGWCSVFDAEIPTTCMYDLCPPQCLGELGGCSKGVCSSWLKVHRRA